MSLLAFTVILLQCYLTTDITSIPSSLFLPYEFSKLTLANYLDKVYNAINYINLPNLYEERL